MSQENKGQHTSVVSKTQLPSSQRMKLLQEHLLLEGRQGRQPCRERGTSEKTYTKQSNTPLCILAACFLAAAPGEAEQDQPQDTEPGGVPSHESGSCGKARYPRTRAATWITLWNLLPSRSQVLLNTSLTGEVVSKRWSVQKEQTCTAQERLAHASTVFIFDFYFCKSGALWCFLKEIKTCPSPPPLILCWNNHHILWDLNSFIKCIIAYYSP